jgi:glucose-6-phosphate 1-dehydrogenase
MWLLVIYWFQINQVQHRNNFLPKNIRIVGYARTKMDHDEYLKRVKSYIKTPTKELEKQLEEFCGFCTYISGQYDKDESFIELEKHLQDLEKGRKETNRIFYMALPPSVFTTVSQHLKRNCYPKNGISRVIVRCPPSIWRHAANQGKTGREALWQRSSQLPRASARACPRLERG